MGAYAIPFFLVGKLSFWQFGFDHAPRNHYGASERICQEFGFFRISQPPGSGRSGEARQPFEIANAGQAA